MTDSAAPADRLPDGVVRLDLAVVLPDAPDARDACVHRLVSEIEGRPGIARVHVLPAGGGAPAQLCIHHDPRLIEVARVRELATTAGAWLTERYGHVVWEVESALSARRARRVAEALRSLPGVLDAEAAPGGPLRIEFDRRVTGAAALEAALARLGLHRATPADQKAGDAHDHDHGGPFGANSELIFAIASFVLLGVGVALSFFAAAPPLVPMGLYAAACVAGGWFTLREAIEAARLGRIEIDGLMLLAAAGAAILGEWAEAALLLALFSLGHALEHHAMGRARQAIAGLADLAPATAERLRDGVAETVPAASLVPGDVLRIRPQRPHPGRCRGAARRDQRGPGADHRREPAGR
jgi:Cd2+/Zn2+-exporting ATPase